MRLHSSSLFPSSLCVSCRRTSSCFRCCCHLWGCIERDKYTTIIPYHIHDKYMFHTSTHNSIKTRSLLFLLTCMCVSVCVQCIYECIYAKQSAEVEVECIYSCGVPNINIYLFVWHGSEWVRERESEGVAKKWMKWIYGRHIYTNDLCLSNTTFKICFLCDLIVYCSRERKRKRDRRQ